MKALAAFATLLPVLLACGSARASESTEYKVILGAEGKPGHAQIIDTGGTRVVPSGVWHHSADAGELRYSVGLAGLSYDIDQLEQELAELSFANATVTDVLRQQASMERRLMALDRIRREIESRSEADDGFICPNGASYGAYVSVTSNTNGVQTLASAGRLCAFGPCAGNNEHESFAQAASTIGATTLVACNEGSGPRGAAALRCDATPPNKYCGGAGIAWTYVPSCAPYYASVSHSDTCEGAPSGECNEFGHYPEGIYPGNFCQ